MSGDNHPVLPDTWTIGWALRSHRSYLPMAAGLVEGTGVGPGDRVLDVGCGTGNVALTAARRDAAVTAVDIAPSALDRARRRATSAGVTAISWRQAAPSALPFEADAFDVVLSSLGHVFGEPSGAVSRELCRTTGQQGRLGLASWTSTGLLPVLQGVLSSYLPVVCRSNRAAPPFLWGDPAAVRRRLEPAVEELSVRSGTVRYPTASPTAFWAELKDRSPHLERLLTAVRDRSGLRREALATIDSHFDGRRNVIELDFRLALGRLEATAEPA